MQRLFIVFLIVFLAGLVSFLPAPPSALACSGGDEYIPTLQEVVAATDVMVKAEVIQMDDASKNAILHVEKYLMGSGSDYLLLYQVDPALEATFFGRHYDTGCTYGGPESAFLGQAGYFALTRNRDGSYAYARVRGLHFESHYYPTWFPNDFAVHVNPNEPDGEDNWQMVEVPTEEAFETMVAEMAGATVVTPTTGLLPRLAPLLITTATGGQYLLPIDNGPIRELTSPKWVDRYSPTAYPDILREPFFCEQSMADCRATTPDGSLQAAFTDTRDEIIVDYYPYTVEGRGADVAPLSMPIYLTGQALAFSSTGEVLIVLNDGKLHLYLVNNQFCECMYGEFVPHLDDLMTLVPTGDGVDLGQIRWSADGTTLAYADASGVWVMDIFHMATPTLLIDAQKLDDVDDLRVVFVSTTGRYVGYQSKGADWVVVDRVTGSEMDNALPSPNERYMAQIAPPDIATTSPATPESVCTSPLDQCAPLIFGDDTRRFEWLDDSRYYVVTCQTDDDCHLQAAFADYRHKTSYQDRNQFPEAAGTISDAAYEPTQGVYAVAQGSSLLILTPKLTNPSLQETLLEMDDQLDSPIVDITWLPSLFYEGN